MCIRDSCVCYCIWLRATWLCYQVNFTLKLTPPPQTYGAGRPHVGLCPIFLVTFTTQLEYSNILWRMSSSVQMSTITIVLWGFVVQNLLILNQNRWSYLKFMRGRVLRRVVVLCSTMLQCLEEDRRHKSTRRLLLSIRPRRRHIERWMHGLNMTSLRSLHHDCCSAILYTDLYIACRSCSCCCCSSCCSCVRCAL